MQASEHSGDLLMAPRRDDRRLVRPASFGWRVATAKLRMLPSFLIVGAMKSGTSSLFNYLSRCDGVAPPYRKETHYFGPGLRAGRSEAWYRAHFPMRRPGRFGPVTGEATPDYSVEPGAAEAIHAMMPHARIVFVLRDPVERAISHYFHEVRMGRETLPIGEAMRLEPRRLDAARRAGPAGIETLMHANYVARGRYHEQVARYRSLFTEERVLVVNARTLFEDPAACCASITEFLDLPPCDLGGGLPARNKGENRTEVPGDVRSYLADQFEAHDARLWALLGRKMDW